MPQSSKDTTGSLRVRLRKDWTTANLVEAALSELVLAALIAVILFGAQSCVEGARETQARIRSNVDFVKNAVSQGRQSRQFSGLELRGAELDGLELDGSNLTHADLVGAQLRAARLSDTILSEADLSGADLRGAFAGSNGDDGTGLVALRTNFEGADLREANLQGARFGTGSPDDSGDLGEPGTALGDSETTSFAGANLEEAFLQRIQAEDVNFRRANLDGAELRGATLQDADLSGATLRRASLINANLLDADVSSADLEAAVFDDSTGLPAGIDDIPSAIERGMTYVGPRSALDGVRLDRIDLRAVDLSGARLRGASFEYTFLGGASLRGADLSGATFAYTDLRGADLAGAVVTETTVWNCVQFDDRTVFPAGGPSNSDLACGIAPNDVTLELVPGARLVGAPLSFAFFESVDGTGSISLQGADLTDSNLTQARLTRADLGGAALVRSRLDGADLSGAKLDGADLGDANLRYADLTGASLTDTDLSGVDLSTAKLAGTNLQAACWDRVPVLPLDYQPLLAVGRPCP